MSATRVGRTCLYRRQHLFLNHPTFLPRQQPPSVLHKHILQRRTFTSTNRLQSQKSQEGESFSKRLGKAWRETKIEWKPIPVGLGIGFLGFLQFLRLQRQDHGAVEGESDGDKPAPKRKRIRPSGGWQVQIMSTLPLKAVSRVWGWFNELVIPYYLRVPGFKLYGWIFGVNFKEIEEQDLHEFPNLAAFFYRTLKPGVRPLDPNPNALLSPADGKVLQYGIIEHGEVEQVKGMTYSLDALLGRVAPHPSSSSELPDTIFTDNKNRFAQAGVNPDATSVRQDEEFAQLNGISYTLPNLFSGSQRPSPKKARANDQSTPSLPSSEAAVRAALATQRPWWAPFDSTPNTPTRLYYMVIYLAPGDYHRFHSPVSWVCSTRRHFAGELYSVSPYVQRTLPGLFTLNERVVLIGKWKYGFFSYTPVGATNVGSIKINFDKELRTNSLTTDTEADRQAAAAADRGEPYSGFSEASYGEASKVLGGFPLKRGEEMGGFQLGSSIVIVFEAPSTKRRRSFDEGGLKGGETKGGWNWNVEKGQKVKVGQALGCVIEED